jgi:hypothetical protein
MIPVIGVPIVNGVYLLEKLIESIDYPVNHLFIINNNGRGEIDQELDEISKKSHKYINKIKVSHLPSNLGCSGSWNLIIKCYMTCPYWIICSHDISFSPGLLMEVFEKMQDPNIKFLNYEKSWEWFAIRDTLIQECGLFDENFYPAYCEDVDYFFRLKSKKIPISKVKIGHNRINNEGSQTWRKERSLEKRLSYSNESNMYYIVNKWGYNPDIDDSPWHISNPYKFPFNNPNVSISDTSYDLKFIRRKHLGF